MFRPYRLTQEADFAAFSDAGVHARMLRDSVRVASFKRAVDAIVRPGMRVLDIGAGTGILSFWAARAGAEVIAVEASSIAEVIPALAARNGLVDRIHVDPRRSFDINLRDRCELLIIETLGHMGIDEGIVFASADAKARLLTPTAPIIPRSEELLAMPVASTYFWQLEVDFWKRQPLGFDMSSLAERAVNMSYITTMSAIDPLAANWQPFFSVVLGTEPMTKTIGSCEFLVEGGLLGGFALTFRACLGNRLDLCGIDCDSWYPLFLPLRHQIPLHPMSRVRFSFELMGNETACRWFGEVWDGGGSLQSQFENGYCASIKC